MSNQRPLLHALTSLRFFAALLVVVFHDGHALLVYLPSWVQSVAKAGFAGVPFFFILSGFILIYNYLPRRESFSAKSFWIARFARIYPVYAVSMLVSLPIFILTLLHATSGFAWFPQVIAQGLLVFGLMQAWVPSAAFLWNGPAWSLSVEAFFYAAFPWLMRRRNWRTIGVIVGANLVGMVALVVLSVINPEWRLVGRLKSVLGWSNPLLWLPLFFLGMGGGWLFLQGGPLFKKVPSQVFRVTVTLTILAIIIAVMASDLKEVSMLLFCYALSLPCLALILLLADSANPITWMLSTKWLVLLGEASYALYILHRPIHDWLQLIEQKWAILDLSSPGGFMVYLFIAASIALLSVKYFEEPTRRWIRKAFGPITKPMTTFGGVRATYNISVTR